VLVTTLNIVVVASVAVAVTEIGTVIITMIEVGVGIEVGTIMHLNLETNHQGQRRIDKHGGWERGK
jgi:hypothetical protein